MSNKENKTLTPELEERLRKSGLLGFSTETEFYYTPKFYRGIEEKDGKEIVVEENVFPKEVWPVFKIKPLTGLENSKMMEQIGHHETTGTGDKQVSVFKSEGTKTRVKILTEGLLDWKNFKDEKGIDVPYRKNGSIMRKDCLDFMSFNLQVELSNAICDRMHLTKEELEGLGY